MKKTMFITSVIMVVVMAIALTTSSLAWFSANGDSTVTTNTLQLTAASSASEGISISSNGIDNWSNKIDLVKRGVTEQRPNGNAQDLNPLVPFTKSGSAATTTELITALLGGTEDAYYIGEQAGSIYDTTGANEVQAAALNAAYAAAKQNIGTLSETPYDAYMIGAEVSRNNLFDANVDRTGFMYDTFYIKNDATGLNAENIKLNATVSFKIDATRPVDANHDAPWIEENVEYNAQNRGPAQYASDATLCVVVLVAKNQFDSTDNINTKIEANKTAAEADRVDPYDKGWDATNPNNWEILVFAKSKLGADDDIDNATVGDRAYNITLGKEATDFDAGSNASDCTKLLNLYAYMNTKVESYDYLRPERAYEGNTIAADKKLVKVIAWYDGEGLNNNNSELTNIKFDLTFGRVDTNTAWNANTADSYNP